MSETVFEFLSADGAVTALPATEAIWVTECIGWRRHGESDWNPPGAYA